MRFSYDAEADAAMIYLDPVGGLRSTARSDLADIELDGSSFVLDFDADNRLISIEILGASKVLPFSMLRDS